jgi:two-component sensor histidine kinase
MARFLQLKLTISMLAGGLIALALIVGMSFWLNLRTQNFIEQVTHARALSSQAVTLRSAMQAAESSQRGFLYTQNEIYLAPYNVAKTQARRQLENLQLGLTDYAALQAAREKLNEVVEKKFAEMDGSIQLQQQGKKNQAYDLVQTNQGKTLMDEANVYLAGIVRQADDRVVRYVTEQRENASQLQLVSILSALAILAVVGIVTNLVMNYTYGLKAAQQEVNSLNVTLEDRVKQRTNDLAIANDKLHSENSRAEALLLEVNHRVANSLTLVSSLVAMQSKSVTDKSAKNALDETRNRIHAVALVHRKLYTSGDVGFVELDDYLSGLVADIQSLLDSQQMGISIKSRFAKMRLPIDLSINLGVILNEWVTNAVKYAYPNSKGEIRIDLDYVNPNQGQLVVSDDGVGIKTNEKVLGTGFGGKIVGAMANSLAAKVDYKSGEPGTIAILVFPLKESDA